MYKLVMYLRNLIGSESRLCKVKFNTMEAIQ
jgi:hypothetical protein